MMFTRYMRGMVYWCDMPKYEKNPNVQAGMRPVVIVSNNIANCASFNVTVVPCTTNIDKNPEQPTHTILPLNKDNPSLVLCEDVMTINKDLLAGFMGMLDDKTMKVIDECLMAALGLRDIPNPFECRNQKQNTDVAEKKHKKRQSKRICGNSEMRKFLDYYEQYGIEKTMAKYNIPNITSTQKRLNYYKDKLNIT